MWFIPEEGIIKDKTECDAELRGHAKKLIFTKFHPSADTTLASAAADCSVKIWDVTQQKCVSSFEDANSFATGLEWSHNGSLLGLITKDKQAFLYDPRKEGAAMVASTHEGARPQKICWMGNSQHILTTGFSKTSERQYAVWDNRDLSKPLLMRRLDDYNGIAMPFFDEETKIVFIAGKGESAVSFY
jgi:WD40 repeat protein